MASNKIDFKDVSPAWKVLQMKLREEEADKKLTTVQPSSKSLNNPFKKTFKKGSKSNKLSVFKWKASNQGKTTEKSPLEPNSNNSNAAGKLSQTDGKADLKQAEQDDEFTKVVSKKERNSENRKRRAAAAAQPSDTAEEAFIQAAINTASTSISKAANPNSTHLDSAPPTKRSKIIDIPVLIKDNERGLPTRLLALDCEYVGAGNNGSIDILARVSIVNENGKIVYDKYVKPTEPITDYRTFVSGIRPKDLEKGESFTVVQREVANLLQDRIVVGHAIHNDFRVLKFNHKSKLIRDTAKCRILRTIIGAKALISLKRLAKDVLGIEIQQGEHDSITDARVALRLYLAVEEQWEKEIKRFHWQKS